MEDLVLDILSNVAKELKLKLSQIENTVNLFDEGATVPFIARYRKEVTGNLDEDKRCNRESDLLQESGKKKRRSFKID